MSELRQKKSGELPEEWEPPSPPESDEPPSPPTLAVVPARVAPAGASGFRRRHFPSATRAQWNDWRWQVRHRVTSPQQLASILQLGPEERAALATTGNRLPMAITPYYLSLMEPTDLADPLRRTMVPRQEELLVGPGEEADPLHEEAMLAAPNLVHRYPDRVLLLATGFCAAYCRYCTRSRMVGGDRGGARFSRVNLEKALAYIQSHPQVRDVLISGGDPLTMAPERLEWILASLRRIPHVEIIRIGSKVPAVLPQRITPDLVRMLRRYHPLFISLHFTHPAELTPQAMTACGRLADAGIPLGSQTVLLKGVNDKLDVMKDLMHSLLRARVRPYYLYQCDPIVGSAHLRTTVAKGLELIQGLRGHTSGYAVPTYIIDAPGGGGKVPICPENVLGADQGRLLLRNYQGDTYSYPDPQAASWAPQRG